MPAFSAIGTLSQLFGLQSHVLEEVKRALPSAFCHWRGYRGFRWDHASFAGSQQGFFHQPTKNAATLTTQHVVLSQPCSIARLGSSVPGSGLKRSVQEVAASGRVPPAELRKLVLSSMVRWMDDALSDHVPIA